eukprot:CAMPEP_0118855726 /NCGR_PEP_ID=MMETSP1163-20130328/3442_1 /TAXON_ID=124430 /ORGANISM="Phaeomonas parva, Strain CCMP2877" /LENGTH=92 /DNA_ID=CAMNT_0006788675 /DNA_START=318 /DNA_END=596 /DNA_ORIENTATION=-
MCRNVRAVLLYRSILKQHRALPDKMRELGDAYVKTEFGRHKNAEPKFLGPFYTQWEEYLRILEEKSGGGGGGGGSVGRNMGAEEVSAANPKA